ncbi:MAG: hypothetical protein HOP10_04910 [Chitinophagaceae bacterium]|nr:hypothetical protein [Chitinophagaceae bacterium]
MIKQSSDRHEPDVSTANDLQFWEENGYVIIHHVISQENCKATEELIWHYLGMDKMMLPPGTGRMKTSRASWCNCFSIHCCRPTVNRKK